ncbi:SCP-domain-containing protein [Linderina pennispora]|uniref:SCP-domain-containing protein n=1 Tax=Linderina pennispora TaxID=61395 RepID=A0A1Y1VYU9_9FUNG|nr:SCP-domain-containing protein [Linderina pennispora]ORX66439.1 SCP-domain-containing protein [Linderina pennispora]
MVSFASTLVLASTLMCSLVSTAPIAAVDGLALRNYQEYNTARYHPAPVTVTKYVTVDNCAPTAYQTSPAPATSIYATSPAAPSPVYTDSGDSSSPSTSFSSSGWHNEMLKQVNAVRARNGKGPLAIDERLNTMAQKHSDYQNSVSQMTHDDSAGSLGQRCSAVGITWTGVAENVAWNYPDVTAVMNGWIDSPGHFRNLIGDYTLVGFGYNNGYATQDFACT